MYNDMTVGLRYFNMFGKRQDPNRAYAEDIPKWTASMIKGDEVKVNGDGESSRDCCFVDNVVQANLLSATADTDAKGQVYNVAVGGRTTLNQCIRNALANNGISYKLDPFFGSLHTGDVRHSQADVRKAHRILGYEPSIDLVAGVEVAMPWYIEFLKTP